MSSALRRHGVELQVRRVRDPGLSDLDYVEEINGARTVIVEPANGMRAAGLGATPPSGRWLSLTSC